MSERDEANLRDGQREWQTRQDAAGGLTFGLAMLAVLGLIFFICAPSPQTAAFAGESLVLVLLACARLLWSAATVVAIRDALQTARLRTEVIDVEVIEPATRWDHSRQLGSGW